MGFFRLIFGLVFCTILFFMVKEIMNVRKKSKAEEELNEVRTEHEIFEMEKETVELERKIEKGKEALYSREEEVVEETESESN